jgi:hypothetical protein
MNFGISWVLGLFKKPQVEITFEPEAAAWPFPVPEDKKPAAKKRVKKTKPLPSRATRTKQAVGKKATKVAKKATK